MVNWHNWFLPSSTLSEDDENVSFFAFLPFFIVTTCDETNLWNVYDTKTSYYVTANFISCYFYFKGSMYL